jgi:hypothetical protein
MKLSAEGDILDSVVLSNAAPPYVLVMGIIAFEGYMVTWGRIYDAENQPTGVFLMKTDEDLNILSDTIFSVTNNKLWLAGCIKNSSDNLILSGSAEDTLTNVKTSLVWEVNPLNLSRLQEKYYDMQFVYNIMEFPTIGGYLFYYSGFIYGLDYSQ